MPSNSNDGTETSLRNIVTLLSGESGEIVSSSNDSTEESLRKVVTLLGSGLSISNVAGLQTELDGKQQSGSYATLVNGVIPLSQLPTQNALDAEVIAFSIALG
jgi:hypothetical protein